MISKFFEKDSYVSAFNRPKHKKSLTQKEQIKIWIKQIANDLGEEIGKFKGAGSFGWTYETKSGKILKLTGDPIETKLAYKLSKNKGWYQYIINYYNIGMTNRIVEIDGKNHRIYYLLMDKVDPIENTPEGEIIAHVYTELIQYQKNYYENITNLKKVKSEINKLEREKDKKLAYDIYPHILNIVTELKKYHIVETDFHSGNIGWNSDKTKLILYDLGGYIDNPKNIIIKDKLKKFKLTKMENFITKFSDFQRINEDAEFELFESIRDEYADMFAPRKPEDEPQEVPGFEGGTIDPEDDDHWRNSKKSDKDIYQDFLKVTKERNFRETEDEIVINMKRLWYDFLMTIYDSNIHYKKFLRDELVGKYVSKGYRDYLHSNEKEYEGVIKEIGFLFDGDSCFVEFQLKEQPKIKNGFVEDFITIDKMKSTANQYNL